MRGRKKNHPTERYLVSEMLNRRKLEDAVSVADLYGKMIFFSPYHSQLIEVIICKDAM